MAIAPPSAKWVGVTYSRADLENVARYAGFTGEDVTIAGAVALAESGGQPARISPPNTDGTYDYGAWQINGGAHPEKFTGRDWSNPATNAVMAHEVWAERGGSWAPWTVYQTGKYKDYLPDGSQAGAGGGGAGASGGSAVGDAADAVLGPLGDAGDAIGAIGEMVYRAGAWLGDSDNWLRVLQVVVGGGLTIAALAIVAKPAVSSVAGPVGKIIS